VFFIYSLLNNYVGNIYLMMMKLFQVGASFNAIMEKKTELSTFL